MESNSSNDLGERLMSLPLVLRQNIVCSFTPKERRHLRLVNKAMLAVVDRNMSDVEMIKIEFRDWPKDQCDVVMKTVNPYNGDKQVHKHLIRPSTLPFLLKWAGIQLKILKLVTFPIEHDDDSYADALYPVLEALNRENICPKLKDLGLDILLSIWDKSEIISSELLKYVTKRQLQAKAANLPAPFLHSLSLSASSFSIASKSSTVDPLHSSEKRRKFLQDLLDQCHGLKELYVDKLLVQKDLPIIALRYPTTLTWLKSERLGTTPGDLHTIIDNCPNLQIINLHVGFPRDDTEVHALASLSDLRELTLERYPTEEEIVRIFPHCFAAFEYYPFGASIARPWPQLASFRLICHGADEYTCSFGGGNNCITSFDLERFKCHKDSFYTQSVQQYFKALNSEYTFLNLMELNVRTCELVSCIAESLRAARLHHLRIVYLFDADGVEVLDFTYPNLPIPSLHVFGILNDLLAFVTKRQSEVRLGKPFLRSLSIEKSYSSCDGWEGPRGELAELPEQIEQIHTTVQQILDQCHGLEDLFLESLEESVINPNKKKGKELMELVPLRFPTTLKKLNGVWLH